MPLSTSACLSHLVTCACAPRRCPHAGDSPYGLQSAVGNVWQYTDEFHDAHTRAVVVVGGSNYRPSGSKWYFPQAARLDLHNKYDLFGPSYERAGTLGFRCAQDAA